MRKQETTLSILPVLAILLAFSLVACSGDDSTSGNDVESSDDSYSLEASSSSIGNSSSSSKESSSSEASSESSSSPVSSSSVVQSSSSIVAVPCKTETEDNCKYGTLVDERDGQTYRTVIIGEQEWMAENLNYAYLQPTSTLDSSSWCYDNDPENCETYGRLYLWSAAVDSAALFSEDGKGCGYGSDEIYCTVGKPSPSPCHNLENAPIRGVCPGGWHMPSHEEWSKLFLKPDYFSSSPLKSRKGWEQGRSGTDDYGFEALPSGFGGLSDYSAIRFYLRGKTTGFWTRDNLNRVLDFAWEDVEYDFWMDEWTSLPALPIRCIKDE